GSVTALQHDGRATVDIDQTQGIAWVDQMRVLDLAVDLPDLGPKPWVAQEDLRDAPQGIAAFYDITLRGIGVERQSVPRWFRRGRRGRRARINGRFHRRSFVTDDSALHG